MSKFIKQPVSEILSYEKQEEVVYEIVTEVVKKYSNTMTIAKVAAEILPKYYEVVDFTNQEQLNIYTAAAQRVIELLEESTSFSTTVSNATDKIYDTILKLPEVVDKLLSEENIKSIEKFISTLTDDPQLIAKLQPIISQITKSAE